MNNVNALAKMNNTLQTVVTKSNALKQESNSNSTSGSSSGGSGNASPMEVTPRLQQTSTAPAKQSSLVPSKVSTGDVDDIPLNSRIPSPQKHKSSITNQQAAPNAQQLSLGESDLPNHTSEHKIGGGKHIFLSIII